MVSCQYTYREFTNPRMHLFHIFQCFIITPTQRSCWGVYWFHSVRPSIRPSVHPASHVRSVTPTVLVGFISYLYILSSNFRWCVACKASCKILNFWQFCLLLTWDLMWITSMANHGAAGVISENAGVLVVLVQNRNEHTSVLNEARATPDHSAVLHIHWFRKRLGAGQVTSYYLNYR